jgi:hypothetical protein
MMQLTVHADSLGVTISNEEGSFALSPGELRLLLDQVPDLVDQGLQIPLLQSGNPAARTNRALAPMAVLPDAARSADPTEVGAGVFLHSPLFGVFAADLTPDDCVQWGRWLLGQHPGQSMPPDATLN